MSFNRQMENFTSIINLASFSKEYFIIFNLNHRKNCSFGANFRKKYLMILIGSRNFILDINTLIGKNDRRKKFKKRKRKQKGKHSRKN